MKQIEIAGRQVWVHQTKAVPDWITTGQFTDIVAISQMTPGPIGINSATYCGYMACHNAGLGTSMSILGSCDSDGRFCRPTTAILILRHSLPLGDDGVPNVSPIHPGKQKGYRKKDRQ